MKIELEPLTDAGKENFIIEIQAAFKKAVVEEFGDDGEEVIPREDQRRNCRRHCFKN